MSKLSKAIKAVTVLNEEEKVDLADFFKKEEVKETKEQEEARLIIEKETKEKEEKIDEENKSKTDFTKLFETMSAQIKTLTEKVEKSAPFGAKQKQLGKKDTSEFDDVFANLRSKQSS